MTGINKTELEHKQMILAMALSQARARRRREHPDWPQNSISDEDYAKIIEEYERCTGLAEPSATITKLREALTAALAAKAQAEEDAHYANGVTDLALQRRDTAEAQVAAILGIVAQFRNGRIEGVTIDPGLARTQREIDAAAAANDVCDAVLEVLEIEIKRSMPDSAAKLRAVVDAAEKLHGYLARTKVVYRDSTNLRLQATPHYEAFDNAVAAYKASRTGEDEQEDSNG